MADLSIVSVTLSPGDAGFLLTVAIFPLGSTSASYSIVMVYDEAETPNLACNVRLPLTVNVYVAVLDTWLPLSYQPVNVNPVVGTAVSVAVLPQLYVPEPVTVP